MKKISILSTLAAIGLASQATLSAADITWDGSANNNWRNNSNWSGGGEPGSSDHAIFPIGESRNDVDLSNSSGDDVTRIVNIITLNSDGANGTTEPGFNVHWNFKKGAIRSNTLRWYFSGAANIVTANGVFNVPGGHTTTFEGSSGIHHIQHTGNITGSGTINLDDNGDNGRFYAASAYSFSGIFNLIDGTLYIQDDNAFANARVQMQTGGLNYVGQNPTFGALVGYGDVSLHSATTLSVGNDNTSASYTGDLSGSGNITKVGTNTWTLTGNHTHSGSTTVNNGTIKLDGSSTLTNSSVDIDGSGTLTCNSTSTLGNLNGSGTLNVNGDVTIKSVLYVSPTFSGTLNGTGALSLSGSRSIQGTNGNYSGDVTLTGGSLTPGATRFQNSELILSADNALNLNTATTLGNLSGTGDLTLSSNLSIGNSDSDASYSGDLSGNSTLTKIGSAIWTYSGTQTGSGAIDINSGTLSIEGSSSGTITVKNGGTLAGIGTVNGATTVNTNGILAPGNSIGTLTFSNDLVGNGYFDVEVDGATNDLIDVAGTLTISNTKLRVSELGSGITEPVTIIASYGTLVGTFQTITDLPSHYSVDYAYDDGSSSNNIALVETGEPTVAALTVNQAAGIPTYHLTFEHEVLGVDPSDFDLQLDNLFGTPVINVSGSGSNYTISVTGLVGDGSAQLQILDSATITNRNGIARTTPQTQSIFKITEAGFSGDSKTSLSSSWNAAGGDFIIVYVEGFDQWDANFNDNSSATFGGVSMTRVNHANYNQSGFHAGTSIFYLASPPTGDNNLVVNIKPDIGSASSVDKSYKVRAISLTGVDASNPIFTDSAIEGSTNQTMTLANVPEGAFSVYGYISAYRINSFYHVNGSAGTNYPGLNPIYKSNVPGTGSQAGTRAFFEVNQITSESLVIEPDSNSATQTACSVGAAFRPASYLLSTDLIARSVQASTTGPTNSSALNFTVSFSEPVVNFDALNDLDFGPSTVTATGANFSTTDNITYTVTLLGLSGEDDLSLSINTGSDVQDGTGNPLISSATSSAVTIDTVAPTVNIFTTSESLTTNANSIAYTVTFDEAITGLVDYTDLYITGTTLATTDLSATTVVNNGDSKSYTITLNNISGDGFLQFRLLADQITDLAGNQLGSDPFSPARTIDNTTPDADSITTTATGPTNATSITYTVHFNEAVINFNDISDLDIGGVTATGASFSGSGNNYTVTLTGISGSGTLTLAVDTNSDVQDGSGNALASSVTSAGLTIDQDAPNATSITTTTTGPTNIDRIRYIVVFDQAVTNFDSIDDLVINSTGTVNIDSISIFGSGTNYTLFLNDITGDGDISVAIDTSSDIQDAAGNTVESSVTSNSIEIDNSSPLVTSINTTESSPTSSTTVEFTVTFSEAVSNFDNENDLSITTSGVSYSSVTVVGTGDSYTVSFIGLTGNGFFNFFVDKNSDTHDSEGKPLLFSSSSSPTINFLESPIHYVSSSGSNTAPYTSWATAAHRLQDALTQAVTLDEVWVAEGTYKPDEGSSQTPGDRTASFNAPAGVKIYGGFPLNGGDGSLSARDFSQYTSILSGDIGIQNDQSDNSYHVVTAIDLLSEGWVDGFTITQGYADGNLFEAAGGGVHASGGSGVFLLNCHIEDNFGVVGGGTAGLNCTFILLNCSINGNAAASGGAHYQENGVFYIVYSALQGNRAVNEGGALALHNTGSDLNFSAINSIIWGNLASSDIDTPNASIHTTGSITYDTQTNSYVQHFDWSAFGGLDGTDPANEPQFVAPVDPWDAFSAPYVIHDADLRQLEGSPMIDAGVEFLDYTTDLNGISRPIGIAPDIGPYEGSVPRNAPVITLNGLGNEHEYVLLGDTSWSDPGATATDIEDGSVAVIVGGDTVDVHTTGEYEITYNATDTHGNAAVEMIRYVYVEPISQYRGWAAYHGLIPGVNGSKSDNPDDDRLQNFQEFVLAGDPLDPSNDGKIRESIVPVIVESISKDYFTITLPVLENAVFTGAQSQTALVDNDDFIITIEGSDNLNAFDAIIVEVTPAESSGMPPLNTGWEYRSFRLDSPTETQQQGFMRINILRD